MLLRITFAFAALATTLFGHSAPNPTPRPPFHVQNNFLIDQDRARFFLYGTQLNGLADSSSTPPDSLNSLTLGIVRQRWNLNTVRLPVSPWIWQRDGTGYFTQIDAVVKRANALGLVVNLAAVDDAKSGATLGTGLPGPEFQAFWDACARYFKDNAMLIFSLYARPSAHFIPGNNPAVHQGADWLFWRNGGTATNGRSVVGMQTLVDTIRKTGATQVLSLSSFHDSLDFQGYPADPFLRDPDVIYEVHPFFDHALTDLERDHNFGFLTARAPVYAAEWGTPFEENSPSCTTIPSNASDAVSQLLVYFLVKGISWSVSSFAANGLVRDLNTYEPSLLDEPWTCGQILHPQPGIGGLLLLWLTGDPFGFGSIAADQLANAAGGPAGAVAPGEVINIFGQLVGPDADMSGVLDDTGSLATTVASTQVLFDGVPAPIFSAGYFSVRVQVPYELAGKTSTSLQAFYRGVPSNRIAVPLTDAAPQLFTHFPSTIDVLAVNPDGSINSVGSPSPSGSIITVYFTGAGQTSPAGVTGRLAAGPLAKPTLAVTLTIGGMDAEVLYAGEAPGSVGIMQVNARVPALDGSGSRVTPIIVSTGTRRSRTGVRIWVQ